MSHFFFVSFTDIGLYIFLARDTYQLRAFSWYYQGLVGGSPLISQFSPLFIFIFVAYAAPELTNGSGLPMGKLEKGKQTEALDDQLPICDSVWDTALSRESVTIYLRC